MKTESFAILLLALFAVSSLKGVRSYEAFDFDGLDGEGVDVNELDDEPVNINEVREFGNAFNELDESDLLDGIGEPSEGEHKHKHVCGEKSRLYVGARCLKHKCSNLCHVEGHKHGKCRKSKSDMVKKCYCVKHKKDCEKEHQADAPAPSEDVPFVEPPSSPAPAGAPTEEDPFVDPPSSPAPADAPAEEDPFVDPPSSSPAPAKPPSSMAVPAPPHLPIQEEATTSNDEEAEIYNGEEAENYFY